MDVANGAALLRQVRDLGQGIAYSGRIVTVALAEALHYPERQLERTVGELGS